MTVPDDHAPLTGDLGVQLERTVLARNRTTLSGAAVALVLGMLALRLDLWALTAAASILAIVTVVVPLLHLPPLAEDPRMHRWPTVVWAGGVVIALAILGAFTAWSAVEHGGAGGT